VLYLYSPPTWAFVACPRVSFTFTRLLIQGVTGGMCETSGECSLGQTIPI